MAKPRAAETELAELQQRNAGAISDALDDLTAAQLRRNVQDAAAAQARLGTLLVRSELLADLFGRRRTLLQADAVSDKRRTFAEHTAVPVVPNVPFDEAVASILEREPRLVDGWREAQRVYTEERGFSLARSASLVLTQRIQGTIARLIQEGATLAEAERALIADSAAHQVPFTRAYAETVYRTNVASAYSAGRLRQAQDPAVRAVTPGWRYDATLDEDVRANHAAADGFVAAIDDPVWDRLTPPLGFNCRCTLAPATAAELRAAGVLRDGRLFSVRPPAGAGPDPGFRILGRPDRLRYGGA